MTDRKEIAAWAEEAYRKNPALPHVKNATNEMRSPYYFWWAFLRLSAEYAKAVEKGGEGCEVVYSAFGDVFRSPFRDWWENKGSRLFCYRLEQIVRVHDATAQSHTVLVNTDGQLVVSFPINGPLNRIWAEIKVLVEDKRAALGPLPSLDADTPLFKLLTSSSVRSHFCRLTTYEMISGGASRSQVAHYLQITQGAEEKDYLRQVDRWHAEAESIVRHVAAGHFPVLNDDPPSPPKAGGVALRRTKKL